MKKRTALWVSIALAGVAFLLYAPTLTAEFVYDDISQVLWSDYLFSKGALADVLSLRVLSMDVLDRNRPTQLLSLIVDARLWGRSPAGFHLTNIALHAAVVVMVFWLVRSVVRSEVKESAGAATLGSAVAALLFAVHPLNSEAVCVISFREDLLVTALLLGGWLLAMVERGAGRWRGAIVGAGCVACMVLATGAKETGIIGPMVLGAYWLLFRRGQRSGWWLTVVAVSLVLSLALLWAQMALMPSGSVVFADAPPRFAMVGEGEKATIWHTLALQPRVWLLYFRSIIRPTNLCADYGPDSLAGYELGGALVALAMVLLTQAWLSWRSRSVFWGTILFWAALLPVSNLVPIYKPIADRFMYMPMVGVALLVGSLVARGLARRESKAPPLRPRAAWRGVRVVEGVAVIVVAGLLAKVTLAREAVWHDSLSLWRATLVENPSSLPARNNLGWALYESRQYRDAIEQWRGCAGRQPDCLAGIALAYEHLGMQKQAEFAYAQAVAFDRWQSEKTGGTPAFHDPPMLGRRLTHSPEQVATLQAIKARLP